jgi:hypothetical protein
MMMKERDRLKPAARSRAKYRWFGSLISEAGSFSFWRYKNANGII